MSKRVRIQLSNTFDGVKSEGPLHCGSGTVGTSDVHASWVGWVPGRSMLVVRVILRQGLGDSKHRQAWASLHADCSGGLFTHRHTDHGTLVRILWRLFLHLSLPLKVLPSCTCLSPSKVLQVTALQSAHFSGTNLSRNQ